MRANCHGIHVLCHEIMKSTFNRQYFRYFHEEICFSLSIMACELHVRETFNGWGYSMQHFQQHECILCFSQNTGLNGIKFSKYKCIWHNFSYKL